MLMIVNCGFIMQVVHRDLKPSNILYADEAGAIVQVVIILYADEAGAIVQVVHPTFCMLMRLVLLCRWYIET